MLLSPRTCDASMAKYNTRHCTPPPPAITTLDSPMLTPSPFRRQTPFLSTYANSPPQPSHQLKLNYPDDDDASLFLSSTSGPFNASQPLLTPVKQIHRVSGTATKLSTTLFATPAAVVPYLPYSTRVTGGTKRKSMPLATPLRPNTLTPLKITHSKDSGSFEFLAPLPAPRFTERTPQTKADTDAYIKSQTATLTGLRLSDHNPTPTHDFGNASDSGCEMDEDEPGNSLFLGKPRPPITEGRFSKSLNPAPKGKEKEEVAEAVSPGGHVSKRRARSRPLSAELLEQSLNLPKSPTRPSGIPCRVGSNRPRYSGSIAFPSTAHRGRASPASSSSDAGSPRPRQRINAGMTFSRTHPRPPRAPLYPSYRPPLTKVDSGTQLFGPAIPAVRPTSPATTTTRSRTNSKLTPDTPAPVPRQQGFALNLANRHSYTGPESGSRSTNDQWNTVQVQVSPSLGSSPFMFIEGSSRRHSADMDDDDDDDLIFSGKDHPLFKMNVTKWTPPKPTRPSDARIPVKYQPSNLKHDSDEDEFHSTGSSLRGDVMPKASTSVSSICSDDALVTPGATPDSHSGWPGAAIIVKGTDHNHPYSEGIDMDAFIMKTLVDPSQGSLMPKKIPGTPVKKSRITYFGNDRPWQSAVTAKIGFKEILNVKKVPRKSMPAVFPIGAKAIKLSSDRRDTDTEEEEYSPSTRRNNYSGLGLGQPPPPVGSKGGVSAISQSRALMRRSSSGAFSSGSESMSLLSTPTRPKGKDWQPAKPSLPLRVSPSLDRLNKGSPRSASGSSKSPTNGQRTVQVAGVCRHLTSRSTMVARRLSDSLDEEPGRFEREFDELEEIGSGEFGRVIKVRRKIGHDADVEYAIKKSKRFEGNKHRLRLREEVDVLKHLSQAALSEFEDGRHPNVLGYMESWEEEEALYIQTELCEYGNLGRFLWKYGQEIPRLDEGRVWKIIVDLSNGLRFIHDSGVIHLDFKPSNVFVTREGRFKIGDFGMASVWPRCGRDGGFEREGDKLYMAPEVLQSRYGKAADVFSFGMTILETATNIVVPDQGIGWQNLRKEEFSQVDLEGLSTELVELIRGLMRMEPDRRMTMGDVCGHEVVRRARAAMDKKRATLLSRGETVWAASPLAGEGEDFLESILHGMDL